MSDDILHKPAFTASHVIATCILAVAMVFYVIEAGADRDLKIQNNATQTESLKQQQQIINDHNDEFKTDVKNSLKDLNKIANQILINQG